ncbi:DUF6233 domain-containing protein [Streptomyces sp. NPDC056061]|uniref:DUF6233 domain-containing protein n=1 Tax=Streptomyces sp. NPDC056061 TaxID=3345700 RepID=UPI0035D65CB3
MSELESWRAALAWLGWQHRQAEQMVRALETELTATRARRPPPKPPDWKLETARTASGLRGVRVHIGDCSMDDGRTISRGEARRALAERIEPCSYYSPENALGMAT